MTTIRSLAPQPRRQGGLGIHSVDHFNMIVPDLQKAQKFYADFGLDVREEEGGLALYTFGHQHRWGRIGEGSKKKMNYLSFGAYAEDMERLRERMTRFGVPQIDAPAGFESNGIWFRDPDGTFLEIRVAEKSSPNEKMGSLNVSSPPGVQGSVSRSKAPVVQPRRLAHILIFTRDVGRAITFYENVVGLRLSDRSGDGIAFMHGIHGSDHHMIALAKSEGPGLHHLSWDVSSINEVGLGAMQMADRGFTAGWGLGRHVLGSNYFHYIRDPWGSYSEYSSDIDYVPVDHEWQSADHEGHDAFYLWGPTPPEDFAFNHEIGG